MGNEKTDLTKLIAQFEDGMTRLGPEHVIVERRRSMLVPDEDDRQALSEPLGKSRLN